MGIQLKNSDRIWLRRKWDKIRFSQIEADKADREWNVINDAINVKLNAEGVTDVVQRDRIKSASVPRKSAYDAGKWHSQNAMRHIADVELFLKLKELEVL